MFFVGATGQLLTLILTVCLPFVFLFSAQPKTELLKETLLIENYENHKQITSIEYYSLEIHFDSVENVQNNEFELEVSVFKKFRGKEFRGKWKSVYSKSSGNKAPPVFPYFSC